MLRFVFLKVVQPPHSHCKKATLNVWRREKKPKRKFVVQQTMIAYIHYLAREENIRPFCTALHRSKRLRRVFNHSRTRLMLIAIALYARVRSTFNSWSTFAASSCPLIIVVIGSMRFVSFNCERCSAYGLPFFYHLFKTDDMCVCVYTKQ